ncbi:MAG: DUF456 family protein [Acidimicrobiia bacterium]
MDTAIVVLIAIVMAIGLAGTVLPILPGLWLMWAGALVYGLLADFGSLGLIAFVVITMLAVAGTAAGVLLPHHGASTIGVPFWGQIVAAAASVVGMFVVPVVGAPLGFLVGVLCVQILRSRSLRGAPRATWQTIKAMAVASGAQFLSGVGILAVWVVWVVL